MRRQRSEQSNLQVRILGLVPRRSGVENTRKPTDTVTATSGQPSTASMEGRNRDETSIDQLLDHRLEVVVVQKASEVGDEPDRAEYSDAVTTSRPI
jgi:hypothetical protein